MEIEVADLELLFDLMDDGDGKVTFDELVGGLSRLRGNARSIDLVTLIYRSMRLEDELKNMRDNVDALRSSCAEQQDCMHEFRNRFSSLEGARTVGLIDGSTSAP